MKNKDFMEIWLEVTDAEVIEKLEILHLEHGIQYNAFIQQAIAEKLRRDGYLQNGIQEHKRKEKEISEVEQLRNSLQKITMRRP